MILGLTLRRERGKKNWIYEWTHCSAYSQAWPREKNVTKATIGWQERVLWIYICAHISSISPILYVYQMRSRLTSSKHKKIELNIFGISFPDPSTRILSVENKKREVGPAVTWILSFSGFIFYRAPNPWMASTWESLLFLMGLLKNETPHRLPSIRPTRTWSKGCKTTQS